MPKQKSSASSATRKKHAKKAAGPSSEVQELPKEKKLKGKAKAKSKAEPKKKSYIPPVRPRAVQPDPLETLGIAYTIPSDLLVILRRLGKKDAVTKTRALEDFQSSWVTKAIEDTDDTGISQNLTEILPVWFHHVPILFLHPSRRIRALAAGIHSSLLQIPSIREQMLQFLRLAASEDQTESILGSWCMLAHDVDVQVSASIRRSWDQSVSTDPAKSDALALDDRLLPSLLTFVQRVILDPAGAYNDINPIQPLTDVIPLKKGVGKRQPIAQPRKEEPRPNSEEEFETEQERKARLRIGAMGALRWMLNIKPAISGSSLDVMKMLLSNLFLWTALYHGERPPFVDEEGLGSQQPVVRKAAWSLLLTLLQNSKGHAEYLAPAISIAVLRSAWVEPDPNVRNAMWQPLLMFLKEQPQSWEIESQFVLEQEADSESDSDDEQNQGSNPPVASTQPKPSASYREFLTFLELGCFGSPRQGYPSLIVIISTISSAIISRSSSGPDSPLTEFFSSFWAAVDARALSSLDRVPASTAFLASLLECTAFLVRRIRNSPSQISRSLLIDSSAESIDVTQALSQIILNQYDRIIQEISSRHLKVDFEAAGRFLYDNLLNLERVDEVLFQTGWNAFEVAVTRVIHSEDLDASSPILVILKSLHFQSTGSKTEVTGTLIKNLALFVFAKCESGLSAGADRTVLDKRLAFTLQVIDLFGPLIVTDSQTSTVLRSLVSGNLSQLLLRSSSLLLVYLDLAYIDEEHCTGVWRDLLLSVSSSSIPEILPSLQQLLSAADKLPAYLKPSDELDKFTARLLSDSLAGNPHTLVICRTLFEKPDHFISSECVELLFRNLIISFSSEMQEATHSQSQSQLNFMHVPLDLIRCLLTTRPDLSSSPEISVSFMPDVYLLAFLSSNALKSNDGRSRILAKEIWSSWTGHASEDLLGQVRSAIKERLRALVVDTSAGPSPRDVLSLSPGSVSGIVFNALDLIPSRAILDELLDQFPATPIDSSLAIVDALVFSSLDDEPQPSAGPFDSHGCSSYARVVGTLLAAFSDNRHAAQENPWALRHFIALSTYAEELLQLPAASSAVFDHKVVSTEHLQSIRMRSQQLVTYVLSTGSFMEEDGWHQKFTAASLSQSDNGEGDDLTKFVIELVRLAARKETFRESRLLYAVLQHLLSGVTKEDADHWLALARKLEKSAPQTSMSIALAVTQFAPEPLRMERYRNELAAGALGVKPSQINSEGLAILRKLTMVAPDPESDIVFLPQTRAVNLIKACQQWVASEEDVDEAVDSEMTLLFFHLAPILQHVAGSHWDFIFDVVENNLDNCSLGDNSTLVTLFRSLKVVLALEDLVTTNRALRAVWEERKTKILTLIRDIVATPLSSELRSNPLSICREHILKIVQHLPAALIEKNTLGNMCHLLNDSSVEVQKMVYELLQASAKKRTEYLVIEAGVSGEEPIKLELPAELVSFLQQNIDFEENVDSNVAFGYLLGWMTLFDLFVNTSLKVKLAYIHHLRELDLIASHFLPSVLGLLELYGGMAKAPKLEIWSIDEFFIQFYDSDNSLSSQLLAAHLYYRALLTVPALIRTWLIGCKDRQLSTAVTTYTSRHFSPVLVEAELARVKGPEGAELNDDNMTIKVSNAASEVTASYSIDEHQIEMTLKIPVDWPLHSIEAKDFKKVAIKEARWRSWILGVQQITWSQSGSIVDGLTLFKKNVAGYFAGAVECAICYSIINATNATLPNLPCNTCNNRFHAACLYEWFNSSHSSSCPLCRSTIIV